VIGDPARSTSPGAADGVVGGAASPTPNPAAINAISITRTTNISDL
jgi:hypothetical protein